MTIFSLCVDDETGRYIAFSSEDPANPHFSNVSEQDAIGGFMIDNPGVTIDAVHIVQSRPPRAKCSDAGRAWPDLHPCP